MRLLILTPEFTASGGGIATFYRGLVPALRVLGVDVRVIEGSAVYAGDPATRAVDGANVEALDLDRLQRWKTRFGAYGAAPAIRNHLAAAWAIWEQAGAGAEADIVEAADWGLLFVPPAVEANRPLVVQGHASTGQIGAHDPLAGEEVQDALIRLIERGVLSARPLAQTYSRANADFWRSETARPVAMIRPALPTADRTPTPGERGLVVGRIQRWKGPRVLCEALSRLGPDAPPMDWIGRDMPLASRGSSTSRLLQAEFPEVWGKTVIPRLPIASADIAARQAAARFNLVPSSWDVFNFTAAEAMASGRPTIVSSGAGASELIVDSENGFVFAAEDAASLAGAIRQVLAMPQDALARIGAAGRETVRRELDPARIARARLDAYGDVIAAFAAAPPAPIGGWLGDLCRPGAQGSPSSDFLGQFPMRDLGRHLVSRLGGRLGAGRGR